VIARQTIFIGSCDGKFYAVEARTGKVIWSFDTHTDGAVGAFETVPLLRGDLVIAGTSGTCSAEPSGYLYALNQDTGKARWKIKVSADSNIFEDIDPFDPADILVFGTHNGELIAIEALGGKIKWRYQATRSGTNCRRRTSVASDGVNVCFLAKDGLVRCFNAKSGRELWNRKPVSPVGTDLLIYKDGLYFGTSDHHIHSMDPANGAPLKPLETLYTPVGGIAESDETAPDEFEYVYATTADGKGALISFSDEFYSVRWSRTANAQWSSIEPEPWGSTVIAGNCSGDFVAYRLSNGEPRWNGHVAGCITGFTHDATTLFLTVHEGALYSYRPPSLPSRRKAE
jgi:outer membrane protein assembly factor BamB